MNIQKKRSGQVEQAFMPDKQGIMIAEHEVLMGFRMGLASDERPMSLS